MTANILLAGFGGQGILFAGKLLAYKGLLEGKHISWLPSYGPEMRGGTANCSVIISDEPIGSPIVSSPDILVAMNLPSLDKYEKTVRPGGTLFVDSTLVGRAVARTDVEAYAIPATQLAVDMGTPTLANMILLGKLIRCTQVVRFEGLEAALRKVISSKHADLLEVNLGAIRAGYDLP